MMIEFSFLGELSLYTAHIFICDYIIWLLYLWKPTS